MYCDPLCLLVCSLVRSFVSSHPATCCNGRWVGVSGRGSSDGGRVPRERGRRALSSFEGPTLEFFSENIGANLCKLVHSW